MRIKANFHASKLPILYRHRFMALIKDALNRSAPDYEQQLYPAKDSKFSKKTKPFTFSIAMPPGRKSEKEKFFVDEGIQIEDTIFHFPLNSFLSFYLSSSDYNFIVNLYNGLLEIKEFKFNDDILLRLEQVFMMHEKKIDNEEVMFKTNAPILIEDKEGKPYMTLTCIEGCFKLKGDPRDLQMLYQMGIGLRTGQGFGMVEVV